MSIDFTKKLFKFDWKQLQGKITTILKQTTHTTRALLITMWHGTWHYFQFSSPKQIMQPPWTINSGTFMLLIIQYQVWAGVLSLETVDTWLRHNCLHDSITWFLPILGTNITRDDASDIKNDRSSATGNCQSAHTVLLHGSGWHTVLHHATQNKQSTVMTKPTSMCQLSWSQVWAWCWSVPPFQMTRSYCKPTWTTSPLRLIYISNVSWQLMQIGPLHAVKQYTSSPL